MLSQAKALNMYYSEFSRGNVCVCVCCIYVYTLLLGRIKTPHTCWFPLPYAFVLPQLPSYLSYYPSCQLSLQMPSLARLEVCFPNLLGLSQSDEVGSQDQSQYTLSHLPRRPSPTALLIPKLYLVKCYFSSRSQLPTDAAPDILHSLHACESWLFPSVQCFPSSLTRV